LTDEQIKLRKKERKEQRKMFGKDYNPQVQLGVDEMPNDEGS
jgi:hypothetical protein